MPDLAPLHPQIVHFAIALGICGAVLRLLSLSGKLQWTRPAGAAALLLAAAAAFAADRSGDAAHGPAERIPGAREAVQTHEKTGERAMQALAAVAALEIASLALWSRRQGLAKGLLFASAAAAVAGAALVGLAGQQGGELVYSYAGGVGTRSGDPADVQRLLVAGLYHQGQAERRAGRPAEAARLTDELVRLRPTDPSVALLAIESMLADQKDAQAALAALDKVQLPEEPRFAIRKGMLRAQALAAAGQKDAAREGLKALIEKYPRAARAGQKLMAELK